MLRPFGGVSVQHALAEAEELLSERPAPDTLPRCQAVGAPNDHIQEQAHVVDHPRHDGMIEWHVLADARLEAELHGSQ
jgi:hypothetical protein